MFRLLLPSHRLTPQPPEVVQLGSNADHHAYISYPPETTRGPSRSRCDRFGRKGIAVGKTDVRGAEVLGCTQALESGTSYTVWETGTSLARTCSEFKAGGLEYGRRLGRGRCALCAEVVRQARREGT